MNAVQYKNLLDHGLTQETIITLEEVFQTKQNSIVTNKDLDLAILTVHKDIQQIKSDLELKISNVQKEIQEVKLELQKEIQEVKVELHTVINNQFWKIVGFLILILSPLYGMVIKLMLQ